MNSFAMSVLPALALRLKMDAEETSVVRLDRQGEQEAFEGRSARSRRVAGHFSAEVGTVLADTKVPMRSTRRYSGQHAVQGVAHRGLLLRVERAHGAHQSFERIARNHFMTFVRQAQSNASPIRLRSLSDQVPNCLKRLDGL
jgi:hypothetical protein